MMVFDYTFKNVYQDDDYDGITVDYEFTPSESLLREAVRDFCHDYDVVIACDLNLNELETFVKSQSLCMDYCNQWLFDYAFEECAGDPETWAMYKEALENEYDLLHPLHAVGMSERDFM